MYNYLYFSSALFFFRVWVTQTLQTSSSVPLALIEFVILLHRETNTIDSRQISSAELGACGRVA